MKKAVGLSFSFIGTVIGAGFATGREISLFFSSSSVISVLFAGFLLGFFCYVILRISARFGDVFSSFGFLKKPLRAFAFLANFCVLCATLAGSENVVFNLVSVRGGAIFSAVICLIVVLFGVKIVKYVNVLVVPVILALVLVVFFKDKSFDLGGKVSFVSPFGYASMNLVTGGFFIGANSDSPTKKESVICAFISGAVLTLMMLCVYFSVKNVCAEMPFIAKADALGLGVVGNIILYLAMLTTITGTLSVCSGKNKILAVIVVCGALFVSSFGFGKIVDSFYPVIGALGGVVTVCSLIIWLRSPGVERLRLFFQKNERRRTDVRNITPKSILLFGDPDSTYGKNSKNSNFIHKEFEEEE